MLKTARNITGVVADFFQMFWRQITMFSVISFGGLIVFFVLSTVIVTVSWMWLVPDIFSGAVKQEILPSSLSLLQALKLGVVLTIMAALLQFRITIKF